MLTNHLQYCNLIGLHSSVQQYKSYISVSPGPPPRWERVPGSAQLGQTLFKVWVSLESTPITIRILISVDSRLGLVRETNMYILVAISLDPRPSFRFYNC